MSMMPTRDDRIRKESFEEGWDQASVQYEAACKKIDRLRSLLLECRDYFEDRADASLEGDPAEWQGNEEMRLLGRIKEVL